MHFQPTGFQWIGLSDARKQLCGVCMMCLRTAAIGPSRRSLSSSVKVSSCVRAWNVVDLCQTVVQTSLSSTGSTPLLRWTPSFIFISLHSTTRPVRFKPSFIFRYHASESRLCCTGKVQPGTSSSTLYLPPQDYSLTFDVGDVVGRRSDLILLLALSLLRSPQALPTASHRRPFRTCSMADESCLCCPLAEECKQTILSHRS